MISFFTPSFFYKKYRNIIIKKLDNVLSIGRLLKSLNEVTEFEKNFSRFIGTKYALGVASGSDALELVLEALGLKGKEILILNGTFVAQLEAIIRTGNNPVLVDSEYNFNFDLKDLSKKITLNTGAVIVSHLYGIPENMRLLKKILPKSVFILEDCSHSHGTLIGKKKVGSFGVANIFSLNPTKVLGGLGDGGIITTSDKKLYQKLRIFSNHGRVGKEVYTLVGRNSRLDQINASFLDFKLEKIQSIIARRQKNAKFYFDKLSKIQGIYMHSADEYRYISFYIFPILLPNSKMRNELAEYLKSKGIETSVHYGKTLVEQKNYKYLFNETLYKSIDIHSRQLSLPIGEHLSTSELRIIVKEIQAFFKKYDY